MKSGQISICPSQSSTASPVPVSYGVNLIATNVAMAKIQTPSEMLLFGDDTFSNHSLYSPVNTSTNTAQRYVWGQNFFSKSATAPTAADEGKGFPFGRHLDGVNMSFCDGHVKFVVNPEKLYNGGSNKPYYDGF